MSKDTSGPAFPTDAVYEGQKGMTLRQYAAIKAMQGLLAGRNSDRGMMDYAETAVEIADALLAELEK